MPSSYPNTIQPCPEMLNMIPADGVLIQQYQEANDF